MEPPSIRSERRGPIPSRDNEGIREKRLIFYKDDIDKINKVLEKFLKLSDSKANILIDKDGHLVTKAGATEDLDLMTISALVAGSFAATREMAKLLGEDEFSVLFHQGKRDSIQLSLIGERTLLATIFDERTTIGMVRLYAKEATGKLVSVFQEIDDRMDEEGGVDQALGDYQEKAMDAVDEFFAGD